MAGEQRRNRVAGMAALFISGLLAGCGPAEVRSVEPARRDPVACASGQIRVCLGRCVTPAQLDQPCTPSSSSATECSPGFIPCAAGLACVSGPGNVAARCTPPLPANGPPTQLPSPDLHTCDPTLPRGTVVFGTNGNVRSNSCVNNTVCMRTSRGTTATTCVTVAPGPGGVPTPIEGLCVAGAVDGETCDSTWDTAITTAGTPSGAAMTCRPCMPGLFCVNNRCTRPCLQMPAATGGLDPGLNSCPRDPTPLNDGRLNQYACQPLYNASTPTAAEVAAGMTRTFALLSSTPNTVCATCAATRGSCSVENTFDVRERSSQLVSVPVLPPLGFIPERYDRQPYSVSLSASSLSTATATPSSGSTQPTSRVNVPQAASATGQWIANPLCCTATDRCQNETCCVPPAPSTGTVPTCTRDADCCEFGVTWRESLADVRGPVPHLIHRLCMSVPNSAAGADRTPHARLIYDAFHPLQNTGCFARNCGGRGQPCCPAVAGVPGTECNGGGLACDSSDNTCQPHCANCDRCPAGEECSRSFCRVIPADRCGRRGESCCASGVDPAVAADGCGEAPGRSFCERTSPRHCGDHLPETSCRACGQVGEQCCPGNSCNGGLLCNARGRCQVDTRCGGANQPCCNFIGGPLCNSPDSLTCVNNQCLNCGGVGERCCGSLHTPNACRSTATGDVSCNMPAGDDAPGPICEPCGGLDQACCYSRDAVGAIVANCQGDRTCQPTGRVGRNTCQPRP